MTNVGTTRKAGGITYICVSAGSKGEVWKPAATEYVRRQLFLTGGEEESIEEALMKEGWTPPTGDVAEETTVIRIESVGEGLVEMSVKPPGAWASMKTKFPEGSELIVSAGTVSLVQGRGDPLLLFKELA
jgi:hypothetical protein